MRFLNEGYLRSTYVQGRLQVRAGKVASISVEDAVHCNDGCSALQRRLQCTASFSRKRFGEKTRLLWNPFPPCFSSEHKIGVQPKCRLAVSHGAVIKKRKCQP